MFPFGHEPQLSWTPDQTSYLRRLSEGTLVFQELRRLRLFIYPILFLFCWHSLGLSNYAHAFDNRGDGPVVVAEALPWLEVNKTSQAIMGTLEQLVVAADARADLSDLMAQLQANQSALNGVAKDVLALLRDQRDAVSSLGEDAVSRVTASIKAFDKDYRTVLRKLKNIQRAETDPATVSKLAGKLAAQLDKVVLKERLVELDPEALPHRAVQAKPKLDQAPSQRIALPSPSALSITGDAAALPSPAAAEFTAPPPADLPGPDDLAETIDIQFTPEIQALAASLGNDPVRMYEYVRNELDYEPTQGSIKGAHGALAAMSGNGFDQASLLIALLRSSGIPARYQYGTIEIPIDKVKNWVGINNSESAAAIMTSGGMNAVAIFEGPVGSAVITKVRTDHVWVQAYTDYTPSRGARQQDGDRWVMLDPAFKQYETTPGIDFPNQLGINAEDLWNDMMAGAQLGTDSVTNVSAAAIETATDPLQTALSTYVDTNQPAVFQELLGLKRNIKKVYGILPATSSYDVLSSGLVDYTEIPAAMRHSLTFTVGESIDPNLPGFEGTDFTYNASLPELAGKRITLSYSPADVATENYLNGIAQQIVGNVVPGESLSDTMARFPGTISPSQVRLIPEIRVAGQLVASGTSIGLGYDQAFNLNFSSPNGYANGVAANTITAGSTNAVVLNLGPVSEAFVKQREQAMETLAADLQAGDISGASKDAIYGEMLYMAGLKYWIQTNMYNAMAQRLTGVTASRLPSEGIFSHNLNVVLGGFVFVTPQTVSSGGFGTDIDHDLQAVVSNDGDDEKSRQYMLMTGVMGSYQEGSVYDQLTATLDPLSGRQGLTGDGVSTAHIFAVANAQGIPIYSVDSTNKAQVLATPGLSSAAINAINANVNASTVVTIPAQPVSLINSADGSVWWQGLGYSVINKVTGAGGYLISGGTAGGGFEPPPLDPMVSFLLGTLLVGVGIFASGLLAVVLAIIGIALIAYDLMANAIQISNNPDLTDDQKGGLIALLALMAGIGAILAVAGIFFGAIGAFVAIALYMVYISVMVGLIVSGMANIFAAQNRRFDGLSYRTRAWRALLALFNQPGPTDGPPLGWAGSRQHGLMAV